MLLLLITFLNHRFLSLDLLLNGSSYRWLLLFFQFSLILPATTHGLKLFLLLSFFFTDWLLEILGVFVIRCCTGRIFSSVNRAIVVSWGST
jgi:hypothetical protein